MQSIPISSTMNQINAHTVHSGHRTNDIERDNSTLASWGQDRDYRKQFDLMINEAHEKLRSGAMLQIKCWSYSPTSAPLSLRT